MIFFYKISSSKVCGKEKGTEAKLEPQFVILAPEGNLKFQLLGCRLQLHNTANFVK
jgi:hypothetical protein